MKKLNLFLGLGAISLTLLFNACEDVINPAPVISFDDASPVTLASGVNSVTLTGSITADAKLKQVVIEKIATLSSATLATVTDFTSGDFTSTDDINVNFRYLVSDITENVTIKFTATDKDDQIASQSIEIQVTNGAPIKEFTVILLGAQSNSAPSALDAYSGVRYSFNSTNPDFAYALDNKANIDIIYYHGSTNLATLAAPADPSLDGTGSNSFDWTAGWSPKNATMFGASSINFDDVTNDLEISEITGLSSTKMTSLGVGSVVAFETVDSKKGLIKVTALEAGSSGSITINIKIQE